MSLKNLVKYYRDKEALEQLSHDKTVWDRDTGTVFHLTLEMIEAYQERAAIMRYGAHDIYPDRLAAEKAAFEDCQIIYLGEHDE